MRDKILEKASDMFLTLGFKSVTMDDLAQELGISKKTIYTHFPNKTKLVEESTHCLFHLISDNIDQICAMEQNPIAELYEIKKMVMSHLKDQKSSPQYQLQKYYPKIYQSIRKKQFAVMEDCTVDNIKRGIELGMYRENINIDFVARIYFSGVMSIKDPELFDRKRFSQSALEDYFLEYHLRGIVTPKGRKVLNEIINSNQE